MKRNNKKGFTLVELVIVIAVIAILAGVLIPTFSGVVDKAQQSASKQEAVNALKEAYAVNMYDGKFDLTSADFEGTFTGTAASYTYTIEVGTGNSKQTWKYDSSTNKWTCTTKTAWSDK